MEGERRRYKVKTPTAKPRRSYRFSTMSLYYDGTHYFPGDIELHGRADRSLTPWRLKVLYYQGQWHQDTRYITESFKDFLLSHA